MAQPLHEGLAAAIRHKVQTGEFAKGTPLPSESDLIKAHNVSRTTVRSALQALAREGLLVSRQGRGWYVRESNPIRWQISRPENTTDTDVMPNDAWSKDVREQGREPEQTIGLELMHADPAIAERLQLEPRGQVWVRRRQRYVDGEFFMTSDSFYAKELVDGTPIAQPGEVVPGVYAVMDSLGVGYKEHVDEIFFRPATAAQAERFGILPGEPIVEVFRTRKAADGRPVSVTVTTAPGDSLVIIIKGES